MTKQQFARLKLKAYNNGKRAALADQRPVLPDCETLELHELEALLNAMQAGQLEGVKLLEAARRGSH